MSDGAERPNFKLKTCAMDLFHLLVSGEYAARIRFGSVGRLIGNYATSLRRIVLCQHELATPPTLIARDAYRLSSPCSGHRTRNITGTVG